MKKQYSIILIVILSLALVASAWFFIIGGNAKINIASLGSYREAILNFEDMNLNTSEYNDYANTSLRFVYNREGLFRVDIIETIADLSNGECVNGENDCITRYSLFDGVSSKNINDTLEIFIPANNYEKRISVNISCIAYSCPQTRDISVRLYQIA